jgi:hypothetical protein
MCNPEVAQITAPKETPVSEDRIERETLTAAPLERVWSLVAQPGFWVADKASLPGTVAREGESMVAKNPEYGDFPVRRQAVQDNAHGWPQELGALKMRPEQSSA